MSVEEGATRRGGLKMEGFMPIRSIDHFTIRTHDLDATVAFYESVLGMTVGDRPAFDFPGAWLYCGDRPLVHVVVIDRESGSETGAFDHLALEATDIDGMRRYFEDRVIVFRETRVPLTRTRQIFLTDPNGITIELNFKDAAL